jgi:SH3-like domain-containing protein
VKSLLIFLLRFSVLLACTAGVLSIASCRHSGGKVLEVAYVSGVQVNLRDRVAAVYEKAGVVKNGDRVEVLDHDRRFAKVRTPTGETGWMEQRFLVSQEVFDQLQKLTAENANDPVQAQGITRNETNLHVEPGRETEHLYQISTGEKLSLLKRGVAEKEGTLAPPPGNPAGDRKAPALVLEDWWLVRDTHGRVGWVLARMVDIDVPLDVAQYAEGQRIVAFFVLNEVEDGDKKVPQYLTVLTEPKDGLPFDFNQIRVFTWNVKRHRYETAYRERFEGVLPVIVGQEDFDKEGTLPVFVVRALDENGNLSERKYKLNTPIVRRVYAPGEEPVHATQRKTTTGKSRRKH